MLAEADWLDRASGLTATRWMSSSRRICAGRPPARPIRCGTSCSPTTACGRATCAVWHPGYGVVLGGAAARAYLGRTGYGPHPAGVTVTDEHLRARADTVRFIAELLRATATPPRAAELLRPA